MFVACCFLFSSILFGFNKVAWDSYCPAHTTEIHVVNKQRHLLVVSLCGFIDCIVVRVGVGLGRTLAYRYMDKIVFTSFDNKTSGKSLPTALWLKPICHFNLITEINFDDVKVVTDLQAPLW